MTVDDFVAASGVSRETRTRLEVYAALLAKWQRGVNLVSRSTLPDVWRRHFLDSTQLMPLLPRDAKTLVDFGSGAGFPGLVLAILGVADVHLIESDQRKAVFLRETARATGTSVTVHARRISDVPPFPADVITARALAPLQDLVDMAKPFTHNGTVMVFPKGQDVERELRAATIESRFHVQTVSSVTEPSARIVRLSVEGPSLTAE